MKKSVKTTRRDADRDTMRAEYDFSTGERGVTCRSVRAGNDHHRCRSYVLDVFPDGAAVNEAPGRSPQ
jgi:hypothetical protein